MYMLRDMYIIQIMTNKNQLTICCSVRCKRGTENLGVSNGILNFEGIFVHLTFGFF